MGRRKKPEEHAHAESWLVSYCDMISLLVTFFLMMMTFSTKAANSVSEVGVGILTGRGGIWKNALSYPEQLEVDPQVIGAMSRDLSALVHDDEGGQSASIQPVTDGFTIGFDLDSSFAPDSAVITRALAANLDILVTCLRRYTHLVVVEGYTDAPFTPSAAYATADDLAAARATAAARYLVELGGIAPDQVQVASQGDRRPRASNDSAAGRKSNRRVEVRVVSLSHPRVVHADMNNEAPR